MRDELHDQRRRKIVEAARQVFLGTDFERATVNAVAKLARVSSATVYIYFENKDRLFEAVTDIALAPFERTFVDLEPLDGDPETVLMRFAEGYFRFLVDPGVRGFYRIVVAEADHRPELGARMHVLSHQMFGAVLRRRFARFNAEGMLAIPDPALSARLFQGMLEHAALTIPLFRGSGAPPLHEEQPYCTEVVRVFLAGHRRA
ncbi:AcrR family transcriptional regulator [Caulobacter ginsengisoli]|uniref:AcrR family transcriptional regulator n=1 Tax=Caulobacter ginsengisoli TaxID=400775 RepID=A0ABU0IT42_9CAUL|nr:TetR/AcrR family transcriptional regulator [Caulobacter ginsengisoli]MDQ0465177.1 AcrR family transcriptional regulator [Caulobacter ginsengisoli]